jgi:hypothetical protein
MKLYFCLLSLVLSLSSPGLDSRNLELPKPSKGDSLFDKLDAQQTGLDFVREWQPPAKWAAEISGSFTGGGVSLGDFDNDGDADVFLSRMTDGGRLYRNLGDFKFEDVTAELGMDSPGLWGAGCTWVDVDGDGWLDLYLCAFDGPNRLFMNQGGKGFIDKAAEMGLDFKGASLMMAFSDYDLDGDLDGYLLTNRIPPGQELHDVKFGLVRGPDGEPVIKPEMMQEYAGIIKTPKGYKQISSGQFDRLYRNDGGTFTEVGKESGVRESEYGLSATWWDYNADGFPDLYVANDFYGADHLYQNQGDGTFKDVAPTALPHTPWFSMGSDVSDINNDGLFDYMASDMAGSDHYKEKMSMGNMTGKDSDSWFLNWPTPAQYMRNAVYLNTGTGRFNEIAFLTGMAATDWTWSIKFGDLDCDGREDVFITTGMSRDWFNSDLRNQEEALILSKGRAAGQAFWNDKEPLALKNWAFRNEGDLKFDNVGTKWGLDENTVSYGAALGDLDGDGDLDLIVNNFGGAPGVYRNGQMEGGRLTLQLRGIGKNPRALGATVRVETTGEPKIQMRTVTASRGFMSSNDSLLHFGLGKAKKIERLLIDWPGAGRQILTDLEAGKRYLIQQPETTSSLEKGAQAKPMFVPSKRLPGVVPKEREYDDFIRQPLLPGKHSQMGPGIAIGDVDGDGKEDVYLSFPSGSSGRLYQQKAGRKESESSFALNDLKPFEVDSKSEDMAPLFFDADNDGDLDLYVVSGGVEGEPGDGVFRDRLYLNAGDGRFTKAPAGMLPGATGSGSVVCACDYDRDGDLDLFVGGRITPGSYPESPASQLLRNEDGKKFVDIAGNLFKGLVTSALWTDADGDGWIDLLMAHEWGPVRYYQNQKGQLVEQTKEAGLAERTGWWNSLAGGDLDGDGDLDYVVGNTGLNTKYEAPALLFYGDVDGSGKKRILEAEFEDGKCFPIRGLSCSSNAMPFLKSKTPKFHDFASATLGGLYAGGLEKAQRFEANTLESGVLINDGKGKFEFRALPAMAQIAPVFGIAICDFDADGNQDLFLAQNSFSPQVETGRMDGGTGILLQGHGDGNFSPIRADRSGLVIPGDAKGVTLVDLNGDAWQDLLVTVNNGEMKVFESVPPSGSKIVTVDLDAADALKIGSLLKAKLSNGRELTCEVSAGGSYLSQSSRRIRFVIPENDTLTEITVRWSDGDTKTTRVKAADTSLRIAP